MANRVFQNVVYQMKDAIDRVVGVVDETGAVIACSELGQIGEMREGFAVARLTAGDAFEKDGYAYHQFSNAKHNDYAVFVEGNDPTAAQFASLLSISLQSIGMNPIHFGVVMIVNLAIGFVTPPIGVNLFVASSLTDVPVMRIAKKAAPMIGYFLLALLLLTFIPAISLCLL